jgi:ribosomal protein S18 acetylase RimI-like enzyme
MTMARRGSLRVRNYQAGDERDIVRLFHAAYGSATGPTKLTAKLWRSMHERGWWNRPSVVEDPECVLVAERGSETVGYLVFHQRSPKASQAFLQELCVEPGSDAEAIARLLIEQALAILRRRGVDTVTWMLSPADPFASSLADAFGFEKLLREPTVFMAALVSLASALKELTPTLSKRLRESDFRAWAGSIVFDIGEERASLQVGRGKVRVLGEVPAQATLTVRTEQGTLCRLLMGALRAEEAYQQDWLSLRPIEISVDGEARQALELLDVLFPENRWTLPRAHSW